MRDERAATPGAANTIVRMMKLILNFAVEEELLPANPAATLKTLKVSEWRAWTDAELEQFERHWQVGTMQRRAYSLALYTGQRKGDLVRMTRGMPPRGLNQRPAGQGDERVCIPEHRKLAAELARGEQHMSLLTTSEGKAFDPAYFGAWIADAIEDAALPDDCVHHGLRKAAARTLADAGCSEEEIKSISGHVSSRMVSHCTKTTEKRKRAKAAILKLERPRR